jgi:site-specific DNA-methyltransferase (adenine-specific)/adenine-specific DNA-methyltransferase
MPTLNWISTSAVVEHHKEVPLHLLKCRDDLSVGDAQVGCGNLFVSCSNDANSLFVDYLTNKGH